MKTVISVILSCCLLLGLLAAYAQEARPSIPAENVAAYGAKSEQLPAYDRRLWKAKYVRPASIPFPADNEYSAARELLGRTLFFDPRLSSSKFISCATCHNPGFSWGDALPKGIGHGMKGLDRKSPTILNSAWAELLFWDGRAETLEEQALGPISSLREMNQPLVKLIESLRTIRGYRQLFERAYRDEGISGKSVGRAIATFERTIVSTEAPFDEWIKGREEAITEQAKGGFDLFNTKAACQKCHSGWNLTDGGFHDIGIDDADKGRFVYLPLPAMLHAFKTPTLRNADVRGPYMHNGSEESLLDVIDLYDKGGRKKRDSLSPEISPLHLTSREKTDLMEFLKTLTSAGKPVEIPILPR